MKWGMWISKYLGCSHPKVCNFLQISRGKKYGVTRVPKQIMASFKLGKPWILTRVTSFFLRSYQHSLFRLCFNRTLFPSLEYPKGLTHLNDLNSRDSSSVNSLHQLSPRLYSLITQTSIFELWKFTFMQRESPNSATSISNPPLIPPVSRRGISVKISWVRSKAMMRSGWLGSSLRVTTQWEWKSQGRRYRGGHFAVSGMGHFAELSWSGRVRVDDDDGTGVIAEFILRWVEWVVVIKERGGTWRGEWGGNENGRIRV